MGCKSQFQYRCIHWLSSTVMVAIVACSNNEPTTSSSKQEQLTANNTPSKESLSSPQTLVSKQPNPVASLESEPSAFEQALDKAAGAASISQNALSTDDWNLAISRWQQAIALMEKVPKNSPLFIQAQSQIAEYQRHLNYANQRATHPPSQRDILAILPSLKNLYPANSIKLQITPSAILLTRKGESKSLTVRAYDSKGNSLPISKLALEWILCSSGQVRIYRNPARPQTITVTAQTNVGYAQIVARSKTQIPLVLPTAVPVTIARLKPGVQLLYEQQIVFPSDRASLSLDSIRKIIKSDAKSYSKIGTFTREEIAALLEIREELSSSSSFDIKYPVILRGKPPAIGSLVVSAEGSRIMGKVLQVQTRGEFSLIQLELVPLIEVFKDLSIDSNNSTC